ncbi:DNA-directed RNA polymerase subunit beta [Candidatus Tremblaya princeps]|uniref:DNA-directed RNA polymerase subunit beta n=1 Tax=Tremblaya princeps TaxID=189385 RepID=A0A143WN21_TREPR|nr:DNA-directed RNA polymerase subunit beta [Candidatus Tremblaya princeps]
MLFSMFPMMSHDGSALIELVKYTIGKPCTPDAECLRCGLTYSAPLTLTLKITSRTPSNDGTWNVRYARSHQVYLGDMPIMTRKGSFIVRGTERTHLVAQSRTPGLFFVPYLTYYRDDTHAVCSLRIIPHRGTWLDLAIQDGAVLFRLNAGASMPATILLKGFGASTDAIACMLTPRAGLAISPGCASIAIEKSDIAFDVQHFSTRLGHARFARRLAKWRGSLAVLPLHIEDADVVNQFELASTACLGGRTIASGTLLSQRVMSMARADRESYMAILNRCHHGAYLRHIGRTLSMDRTVDPHDARACIAGNIGKMRHLDPAEAHSIFQGIMENESAYCLTPCGRNQLNARTGRHLSTGGDTLDARDIALSVKLLINAARRKERPDDVDDMSNRKARDACDALCDALRPAFLGLERRLRSYAANSRPGEAIAILLGMHAVTHQAYDELTNSRLAQPLDQTNPLAEVTHKRRVAIMAGSNSCPRRAPLEARDVHATHYGRLCPVETPEGQNIGLIASLAACARIDAQGTILAPYVTTRRNAARALARYISPQEEVGAMSAPSAIVPHTRSRAIMARIGHGVAMVLPSEVRLVDGANEMPLSAATATIPFLEHNDACRALMGSNMQRQAVPCCYPRQPRVHTGMEQAVAQHAMVAIRARYAGRVAYVDPLHIAIVPICENQGHASTYRLARNARTNQGTQADHRPTVIPGAYVEAGEVIADGPACAGGVLALGRDVLVAFMPWEGYNYEDSVAVSEALLRNGAYTSIHLDEVSVDIDGDDGCGTVLSRCVPGITTAQRERLDERGIVRVGSRVFPGDILVGITSPRHACIAQKGNSLLRTALATSEQAHRDSSIRATQGMTGTVVYARIEPCNQPDVHDDLPGQCAGEQSLLLRLQHGARATCQWASARDPYSWLSINSLAAAPYAREQHAAPKAGEQQYDKATRTIKVAIASRIDLQPGDKVSGRHGNKGVVSKVVPMEDMPYMKNGRSVDVIVNPLGVPSRMNVGQLLETHIGLATIALEARANTAERLLCSDSAYHDAMCHGLMACDGRCYPASSAADGELAPGHGVTLCTLCPAFDGPSEAEIRSMALAAATQGVRFKHGLHRRHQAILYDGRTGTQYDRPVTVGYMYYLKLNHLARNKVHSRSTGPYSSVTEQPLGGKARQGGQRVGEMEVWALEAHGAAFTLQEMLTIKSDDLGGRRRVHDHIAQDVRPVCYGTPESIGLLVRELRALCVDVDAEPSPA